MSIDYDESILLNRIVLTIGELCKEHGTTIKSLEKDLKFGNGTIRRWCNSKPAINAVVKVAQYFNVSVDYLVGISTYKKHESENLTVEEVGLSGQAVESLVRLVNSDNPYDAKKLSALNLLVADDSKGDSGGQLLQSLTDYLLAEKINSKYQIQFSPNEMKPVIVDVLNNSDDSGKYDPRTYSDSAEELFTRAFLGRVMQSLEIVRYQYRNPGSEEKTFFNQVVIDLFEK